MYNPHIHNTYIPNMQTTHPPHKYTCTTRHPCHTNHTHTCIHIPHTPHTSSKVAPVFEIPFLHPFMVLLPGESHGRRSLVGCSPRGRRGSDTTEQLHYHFSLSCTGEGNGNPLQCSCLENPRDGGAWWAAVFGVAQSRTGLKQLSSGSSGMVPFISVWRVQLCRDNCFKFEKAWIK